MYSALGSWNKLVDSGFPVGVGRLDLSTKTPDGLPRLVFTPTVMEVQSLYIARQIARKGG